jgi:hypothetical protein
MMIGEEVIRLNSSLLLHTCYTCLRWLALLFGESEMQNAYSIRSDLWISHIRQVTSRLKATVP